MAIHNPVDSLGNLQVDFVWGNMPLQPDDARDEDHLLDPALNSHYIATAGWNNFPRFVPNTIGDGDPTVNIIVPNVVGLNKDIAIPRLENAGLDVTANEIAGGSAVISSIYVRNSEGTTNDYVEVTTSTAHGFVVGDTVTVVVTSVSGRTGNYVSQLQGQKTISWVGTGSDNHKFRWAVTTNYTFSNTNSVGTCLINSKHNNVKTQSIAPFDQVYGSDVDFNDPITIEYYN